MENFKATLTGEEDGFTDSRMFPDEESAIAWLKGAGLVQFADQQATGEVLDTADGRIVWRRSHLQTAEQADRERTREWGRDYAGKDMVVRPLRGGGGYQAVPLKGKKRG